MAIRDSRKKGVENSTISFYNRDCLLDSISNQVLGNH